MTVLFTDIHENDQQGMQRHRVPGMSYDEVLYADDTICISQSAVAMSKLLASIEKEGELYGMRLNKKHVKLLTFGEPTNITFKDGTAVKPQREVKYLGCQLNNKADGGKELSRKRSDCMAMFKNGRLLETRKQLSKRQDHCLQSSDQSKTGLRTGFPTADSRDHEQAGCFSI